MGKIVSDALSRDRPGPTDTALSITQTMGDVRDEIDRAQKWPAMNSAHEGYAVLLEEVEELKAHVFTNQKRRDLAAMRAEAVQVAAGAIRFVVDVCDGGRGRK